jgi:anthranilate/para-aminobenzoate synthase component II
VRAGLKITGLCENEEVQAVEYNRGGVRSFGLQYHPESFKSEHQDVVLKNWLKEISRYFEGL